MLIRLMVVVVSCLLPAAAPFIAPPAETPVKAMMGIDHVIGERNRVEKLRENQNAVPVRRQFMEPLALPILDDVALAFFVVATWAAKPADSTTAPLTGQDSYQIETEVYRSLDDPRTVQRREVPSLSTNSRRVNLSLETAGVGRWDTALVELWITLDGWTWQLYQHSSPCDSLAVSLPWEGRYGLRVVVHRDGRVSPTPRVGELPQLWMDVNERLAVGYYEFRDDSSSRLRYCTMKLFHTIHEIDQPADVKQAKQWGILHPCGYIKRVETESEPEEVVANDGFF